MKDPPADAELPIATRIGIILLLLVSPLVVTRFTADPFQDAKLAILMAAVLFLWIATPAIRRPIVLTATAFAGAVALGAALGVDPARGLTIAETRNADGGLLVLGGSAVLLAIGSAMPRGAADRARRAIVLAGVLIAGIAVIGRVMPDFWNWVVPDRAMRGATLGHPVFASAVCVAALAAALPSDQRLRAGTALTLGFLALGGATFDERSALILPWVAIGTWMFLARPARRTWLPVLGIVAVALLGYEIVARPLLPDLGTSSFEQIAGDAAPDARVRAWRAIADGTLERPLTGWGPGMTLTAFLRGASVEDVSSAGRGWSDAHSLLVETLASAGILGIAALSALVGSVVLVARRARELEAWALAAAVPLALFAAYEPINVVTTPLLFLLAGVAVRAETTERPPRTVHRLGIGLLAAGVLVSGLLGTAALVERWGTRFRNRDALELALEIQPWRQSTMFSLGRQLAEEASRDPAAASEARRLIDRAVATHYWDAIVRWWAAGLELEMGNADRAASWLEEQRLLFPAEADVLDEALRQISS